jgi:hypothetical protein
MNFLKKIVYSLLDRVNWDKLSQMNTEHVNAKHVAELMYIPEWFAKLILSDAVRQGKAKPCCSHYDSERHKNCYRFLVA